MRIPPVRLDFQTGVGEFQPPGGPVQSFPLSLAMQVSEPDFESAYLDIEGDRLVVTLPGGVDAVVELGVTGPKTEDRLAGRPVVYLDQSHWSSMAAWRYGHRPIAPGEAAAAARLGELVKRGAVVLPMSAAHLVETGPLFGERRVALAATVLEFSQGWQFRNPVAVRAQELVASLVSQSPRAKGAVTLGADVLFADRLSGGAGSDLPGLFRTAMPRVVNVMSTYAAIIDSTTIPDEGGLEAAEAWARQFADLGRQLRAEGASRENVRRRSHWAVIRDLGPEIARLAHPAVVAGWLARAEQEFASMPYLGRYREVISNRLSDGQGRWEGNDLIDLNFLCCAAGYADVVVGERRTIGNLRSARRVPKGAVVATRLAEAITVIEDVCKVFQGQRAAP
jgi:hypothetical protein